MMNCSIQSRCFFIFALCLSLTWALTWSSFAQPMPHVVIDQIEDVKMTADSVVKWSNDEKVTDKMVSVFIRLPNLSDTKDSGPLLALKEELIKMGFSTTDFALGPIILWGQNIQKRNDKDNQGAYSEFFTGSLFQQNLCRIFQFKAGPAYLFRPLPFLMEGYEDISPIGDITFAHPSITTLYRNSHPNRPVEYLHKDDVMNIVDEKHSRQDQTKRLLGPSSREFDILRGSLAAGKIEIYPLSQSKEQE